MEDVLVRQVCDALDKASLADLSHNSHVMRAVRELLASAPTLSVKCERARALLRYAVDERPLPQKKIALMWLFVDTHDASFMEALSEPLGDFIAVEPTDFALEVMDLMFAKAYVPFWSRAYVRTGLEAVVHVLRRHWRQGPVAVIDSLSFLCRMEPSDFSIDDLQFLGEALTRLTVAMTRDDMTKTASYGRFRTATACTAVVCGSWNRTVDAAVRDYLDVTDPVVCRELGTRLTSARREPAIRQALQAALVAWGGGTASVRRRRTVSGAE